MQFPIRINKYIRDSGLASRREADGLIEVGLVKINGNPAKPGVMVKEGDKVVVDKARIKERIYLAYNKPRGLSTQGEKADKSVITEWQKKGLFPVGRLDKESEGLLILTNDGRLTGRILDPDSGLGKEYIVSIQESAGTNIVNAFKKGMQTKTFGKLLPAEVEMMSDKTFGVILHEGKRHQIRVMLAELKYTITSLKRIRIGHIKLGNLKVGETRPLTKVEIDRLFNGN